MAKHQQPHIPTSLPASAFRPTAEQSQLPGFMVLAGGSAADDAEGKAGLVSYKTSHHETVKPSNPNLAGDTLNIQFSKSEQVKNRIKRLKRNVWASGHLHGIAKKGHRPLQSWFVTLTYALANDWRPNHLTKALVRFRAWCSRKGYECKYTWVAEIQPKRLEKTGDSVVHYHLLAWLPVGVNMPHWDRSHQTPSGRTKSAFWTHGMTNTEQAKAGVGYLMKYLSKVGELVSFPDGLRLYGMGGLDTLARCVRSWYNLPQWAKNRYGVGELCRFNGRLLCSSTGEILPPMYRKEVVPGGLVLHLLRDYPERLHDGAYTTFPRATA